MIRFLKAIYRFLSARIWKRQKQTKGQQPTKAKPNVSAEPSAEPPAKPPAKRVLITYVIFSLLFIVLAAAAWFFKGADLLPEHFSLATNTSNTETKPQHDDKNIVVPEELPSGKPEPNLIVDPNLINELQDKVERLKEEMLVLDSELNIARIKQYIASAHYLIETRTAPKQALSLLQAARTDIEVHRRTSDVEMNALAQDIESQIARLQQYIARAPHRALTLLNPLIEHLHTKLETIPKPQAEAYATTDPINESRLTEWLNKIYAAGSTLIRVERPDYQYAEDNNVLFKLLITARSAILLNEQEQFNIALKDALRLIEVMPNPPISQEQIESILSLEINWQLPTIQQ